MTPGSHLTIHKPSFWKSRREVRDTSGTTLAWMEMRGWTCSKAEGEARGRRLVFGYEGWDGSRGYMADMSGQKLATTKMSGWWGMAYTLRWAGRDYMLKVNGWGTTFTLFDGDAAVLRVRSCGFFKPGTVTVERTMEEKDLLPLILFILYQMRLYEMLVASYTAVSVVIISTVATN